MNLNETIINIRVELQKLKLKKSGKNKYAGFDYYELADFLPKLNELMLEKKVNDRFTIENDLAKLELIKGDEKQEYTIPFKIFPTPVNKSGSPSMQDIQYLGALNTYYKRYLYINAFGITDGEVIDIDNMNSANPLKKKLTQVEEKDILDLMQKMRELSDLTNTDYDTLLTYYKVKSNSEMTLEQLQDCVKNLELKLQKMNMLKESGQEV